MAEHIIGMNSLDSKLNNLQDLSGALEKVIGREIRRVRSSAVLLCPVNHGELRQSINTMVEREGDTIMGTCYTNNEHAGYVEFGTGPKGAADHQGISPLVQPSYVYEAWWFPGDNIPPSDAEMYHWPKFVTEEGKILYRTNGQPAQPYMYPALKQNEPTILANIKSALQSDIRNEGS